LGGWQVGYLVSKGIHLPVFHNIETIRLEEELEEGRIPRGNKTVCPRDMSVVQVLSNENHKVVGEAFVLREDFQVKGADLQATILPKTTITGRKLIVFPKKE
jgi:hypothetical protein